MFITNLSSALLLPIDFNISSLPIFLTLYSFSSFSPNEKIWLVIPKKLNHFLVCSKVSICSLMVVSKSRRLSPSVFFIEPHYYLNC